MVKKAGQASQPQKRYKSSGSLIPHEILIDIISRLPAKAVLQWRCVSKIWRDLTSTPDFIRLHIAHNNTTILIEYHSIHQDVVDENHVEYDYVINQQFMDRWWEPDWNKSVIHSFPDCDFQYRTKISQCGFIVMESPKSGFIIFNPVFPERVRLIVNLETTTEVYGMFLHTYLKEYCIIMVKIWNDMTEYSILNLGFKPLLRKIGCPDHKIKYLLCDPVLVDEHLYRMVRVQREDNKKMMKTSILEFDIRSEGEFTLISCPNKVAKCKVWEESQISLVSINCLLSIVMIICNKNSIVIKIWTMRDRHVWTCDAKCKIWCRIRCEVEPYGDIRALSFVNEDLFLFRTYNRLFLCDLKKRTAEYIGQKTFGSRQFFPHVMSLASLRNCQSEIQIG